MSRGYSLAQYSLLSVKGSRTDLLNFLSMSFFYFFLIIFVSLKNLHLL